MRGACLFFNRKPKDPTDPGIDNDIYHVSTGQVAFARGRNGSRGQQSAPSVVSWSSHASGASTHTYSVIGGKGELLNASALGGGQSVYGGSQSVY